MSSGPTTAAGKAANAAAHTRHGAFATSATFREALRARWPEVFDSAGGEPGLALELAYSRATLAHLAAQGEAAPVEAVCRVLDTVRRLAEAVTAMRELGAVRPEGAPGQTPGSWSLRLTVVDGDGRPVSVGEPGGRDDPMDTPPGDAEGEPLDS